LGLAVQWLLCLFGGQNETTSINREEHGASALGGHQLIGRHNNLMGVSNRSSRDVGEEAPLGWSMYGDVSASIWAAIQTTKKAKTTLAARGLEELFFQLWFCVSFWFWREIGFGFTYLCT
jgi:hypothetical protein